jgi:two-component system, NtrC family, response regulator HydG
MRFSALQSPGADLTLAEMESVYIRSILSKMNGNISRAAEILGIDRKTLRSKLKKN